MLELETDFQSINNATNNIKNKLQRHSDGKLLKGDEIVGWLGEVYGKMLLNGTLIPDTYEYDRYVSVEIRQSM
jgi:hypothetical protein